VTVTGYTVVTREPEWTPDQRQLVMDLAEHDLVICNCGCGLPVTVAHDPKQAFVVDEDVCYARRAVEKVRREKHDAAVRAKTSEGWDAGLKLHARPVTPEEVADMVLAKQSGEGGPRPRMAAAKAAGERHRQRMGQKGSRA
jgi:hypothetical protein